MDYKKEIEKISKQMTKLGEETPNQMKAFQNFIGAVDSGKNLDLKTKELIAIALSVKSQCKPCIGFHVSKALSCGAKKDEILEAGWLAVLMGGGPAMMYLQEVEKALEDLEKNKY